MVAMIYICEYTDDRGLPSELLSSVSATGFAWLQGQCTAAEANNQWEKRKAQKLRERLIAWLLLQYAVRSEFGIERLADLEIRRTRRGKPYSVSHPEIWFNLSHCDHSCACILSEAPAGIDVERTFPFRESLARQICTEEEWRLLEGCDKSGREELLRIMWSMKESFVKRDGRGLGYGMNQADLAPYLKSYPSVYLAKEDRVREADRQETLQKELEYLVVKRERYTLAACGSHLPESVVQIEEAALFRKSQSCSAFSYDAKLSGGCGGHISILKKG